jgi:hypothetical protein
MVGKYEEIDYRQFKNYNFIIQSLMKIDEKNCTEIEIRK